VPLGKDIAFINKEYGLAVGQPSAAAVGPPDLFCRWHLNDGLFLCRQIQCLFRAGFRAQLNLGLSRSRQLSWILCVPSPAVPAEGHRGWISWPPVRELVI